MYSVCDLARFSNPARCCDHPAQEDLAGSQPHCKVGRMIKVDRLEQLSLDFQIVCPKLFVNLNLFKKDKK